MKQLKEMSGKMARKALITGVSSQDGSYLAEILLAKQYEVYGLVRSSSRVERISHILDRVKLIKGDMADYASIEEAIKKSNPDEVYNLAAHSSFEHAVNVPIVTCDITALGALRVFEAVRKTKPDAKVFQASSSEVFGSTKETPQNERTRFQPRSPYGVSKLFAQETARFYREHHKLFISCAIMYNHESPRRSNEFVTRKITEGVAKVKAGLMERIVLGNLNSARDWGFAKEYMEAAHLMLQQQTPDDFVIGSGVTHTVKEWLEETCKVAGVDYWDVYTQDPVFDRQSSDDCLRADITKAQTVLKWTPKVRFEEIVRMMYESEQNHA